MTTNYASFSKLAPAIKKDYASDPRFLMALQNIQAGSSGGPVQSWQEGLARVLQAGIGGYQAGKVGQDYEKINTDYNSSLATALAAKNPAEQAAALSANPYTSEMGAKIALEESTRQQKMKDDQAMIGFKNEAELTQMTDPRYMNSKIAIAEAGAARTPVAVYNAKTGKMEYTDKPSLLTNPDLQPPEAAPKNAKGGQTPENAAKISLVTEAANNVRDVKSALFNEQGLPRNKIIAEMQANIPGTEGRRVRNLLKNAINAQLRAESGAAVPDIEVERAIDRYAPSLLDDNATKRQKLDMLSNMLSGTLEGVTGSPLTNAIPPPPPLAPPPSLNSPQPGLVEDGYQFQGGNPADPKSWKPVR